MVKAIAPASGRIAHNFLDLSVGKQEAFVFSEADYVVALAGIGGGKTKAGAIRAMLQCIKHPKHIGLICANTVRQLEDYTVSAFIETLKENSIIYEVKKSLKKIFVRVGKVNGKPLWAEVHYRSMENYNNIRGGEYGWIWLDEARDYKREAFQVILGRIGRKKTDFKQSIFITTTPKGEDWINDFFIDEESQEYLPGVELFRWTTADNHFLNPDYVKRLEDAYDPEFFRQEALAEIVDTTRGAFYAQFRTSMHILDDEFVDYDPHRPLIWCLDFNVDPFCTTIIQQYGSVTYVIDEIVIPDATCDEIVRELKERYPPDRHYSQLHIYGDATARGRNRQTKKSDWAAIDYALIHEMKHLGQYDIIKKVKKQNPRIMERIRSVNARFINAKGEKRLYILKKCKYTVRDCKRLKKKEGSHEVDPAQIKADPRLGHCMDSVGYFIYSVFPLGKMESHRNINRIG